MRGGGVEPPYLSAQAPHACVSAIPPPARHFAIAYSIGYNCKLYLLFYLLLILLSLDASFPMGKPMVSPLALTRLRSFAVTPSFCRVKPSPLKGKTVFSP